MPPPVPFPADPRYPMGPRGEEARPNDAGGAPALVSCEASGRAARRCRCPADAAAADGDVGVEDEERWR